MNASIFAFSPACAAGEDLGCESVNEGLDCGVDVDDCVWAGVLPCEGDDAGVDEEETAGGTAAELCQTFFFCLEVSIAPVNARGRLTCLAFDADEDITDMNHDSESGTDDDRAGSGNVGVGVNIGVGV